MYVYIYIIYIYKKNVQREETCSRRFFRCPIKQRLLQQRVKFQSQPGGLLNGRPAY